MRKITTFFILALFLFACRKKKNDPNPGDVRLLRIESDGGGITSKTILDYDASGRISKISQQDNNSPITTTATITYNGSEVLLSYPAPTNLNAVFEIRLTLDAEKRVTKKIEYSYFENPPGSDPQKSWVYDTTHYEYDAAGLLKKTTRGKLDTTWFSPAGGVVTYTTRTTGGANHTNTNNNLVGYTALYNSHTTARPSIGSPIITIRNDEETATLQHNLGYANVTDFTNAAILNELWTFDFAPLNKKYARLPNKMTMVRITKDQAGNVISTDNSTTESTLAYNSYGFVSTITATNGNPRRLIYNH